MKKISNKKLFIFIAAIFIVAVSFMFKSLYGKAVNVSDKIHFVSARDGDGIIIETKDSNGNTHCGLIDAFNPEYLLKEENGQYVPDVSSLNLARQRAKGTGALIASYADGLGCSYFDFVIFTHNHWDHIGGITQLTNYFNSNTVVFYKEDINPSNDAEAEYFNFAYLDNALQAINSNRKCDVTKASTGTNSKCKLSTLGNSFTGTISYNQNNEFKNSSGGYDTNVRQNLGFSFGNFNINLYSLNTLAQHNENMNSIVTLVEHKSTHATAVLTGDIVVGPTDYANPSYDQLNISLDTRIQYPTGSSTCSKCNQLGPENQIADVITYKVGEVDLLKSAHHGNRFSNSLYAIDKYSPIYYVTPSNDAANDSGANYANVAAMTYLKYKYGTKSYYSGQYYSGTPVGAVTAEFLLSYSSPSDKIRMRKYNANAVSTNSEPTEWFSDTTHSYNDGFISLNNLNFSDHIFIYLENNKPIINDWKKVGDKWYYFDNYGILQTGFFEDKYGDTYYGFNGSEHCSNCSLAVEGQMMTGWKQIDGDWYYFRLSHNDVSSGNEGSMVTGLVTINNQKYYFRTSDNDISTGKKGSMVTGLASMSDYYKYFFRVEADSNGPEGSALKDKWQQVASKWYHFDANGRSNTGLFVNNDENVYYFSEANNSTKGEMLTGWQQINDVWYYFYPDSNGHLEGSMATGFITVDNETYYLRKFDNDISSGKKGTMVTGLADIDNKRYYFRKYEDQGLTGSMVKNGWVQSDSKWYYFKEDGTIKTGLLTDASGDVYFLSDSQSTLGEMVTGWKKVNGHWYYFTSSGKAVRNDWFIENNNKYYFGNDGKLFTGLKTIQNKKYYFSEDIFNIGRIIGIMQTGWVEINNNWYYFNQTGDAAIGWKKISNNMYYFDNDGKMLTGLNQLSYNNTLGYYYFNDVEPALTKSTNSVVHIKNQSDLNNYLNSTGNNMLGDKVYFENSSDIQFPEEKVYYLNASSSDLAKGNVYTYWFLTSSSTGKIDFNSSTFLIGNGTTLYLHATGNHIKNASSQIISNATFYGSVSNQINSDGTVTSNAGNFNADLIHASYITFKNMSFNNSQDVNDHLFDVMGSNYIAFDNVSARGYFGDYTVSQLRDAYNYSNHSLYAEAIQIDIATSGASGISDLNATEIFNNSMNDEAPSTNITIKNSYFGPYKGATGQGIINKNNTVVTKPYGSTVGSHTGYSNGYANIRITNNQFVNTIYVDDSSMTKLMYPVHIQTEDPSDVMTVSNNTFINQYSGYSGYGVRTNGNTGYYGNGTNSNISETNSSINNSSDTATSIKNKVVKPSFTLGIEKTGWQEIDNNTYYFRTADNDVSSGNAGSMVTGLVSINNNTYYFRENNSDGPLGSMLKDECKIIGNNNYCFDKNGVGNIIYSATIPTSSNCINPTYDGSAKSLASAGNGYTLLNNSGTDAGSYTVTARLNNGYVWSNNTTSDITISCSIKKANLPAPSITSYSGIYDGKSHQVTLSNSSGKTIRYSTNGTSYSTTVPSRTNVGKTTVYIKYIGDNNHNDSEVSTGTITISKLKLETPEITNYSGSYDGKSHQITLNNSTGMSARYSTDGSTYSATAPSRTSAGTTTVYVKYIGDDNHADSDVASGTIKITKVSPTISITDEINVVDTNFAGKILSFKSNVAGIVTFSTESGSISISTGPVSVTADQKVDLNITPLKQGTAVINITFVPTDSTNYKSYQTSKSLTINNAPVVLTEAVIPTASSYCKTGLIYNGTQQVLTKTHGTGYTFNNNSATDAGSYTVTATLNDGYMWSNASTSDISFECSIAKASQDAPSLTGYTGSYDGSSHGITVNNGSGKTIRYSTNGTNYTSTAPKRTNAGTTTVYVKFIGNDNYNDSSVVTAKIKINKINPTIEISDEITQVDTNFEGKILTIKSNVAGMFVFSTESNNMELTTGPTSVTANQKINLNIDSISEGTANINISFVPSDTTNYNSYENTKTLAINAAQTVLETAIIPTASEYCKQNLVYTGSQQTLTNTHGTGYTLNNNKGTNAGNYTVTASLSSGYKWADDSTSNKTFVCSIAKANASDFTVTGYTGTYDGSSHGVTVSTVSDGTVKYSSDSATWKTTSITRKNAGTTTVYVYVAGDSNHNDSAIKSANIVINKAQSSVNINQLNTDNIIVGDETDILSLISNVSGTFSFNTSSNVIDGYETEVHVSAEQSISFSASGLSVGTANLNITFTPDSSNYESFNDTYSITVVDNPDYIISVPTAANACKKNLVYNGSPLTLTVGNTDAYEFINNTATNAGKHTVTVRLKGNYKWKDLSTTDKTISCSISKANLGTPTISGYNGDYDGNSHSITASSLTGGSIRYSTDNNTWGTTPVTRTSAGITTVYVKYVGDSNHNDSSVYSTNIIINKVNSIISTANLATTITKGQTLTIGPLTANVDGMFTISTSDSSVLSVPVLVNMVSANEQITTTITGVDLGSASYTITFNPTSSNYNSSSITTNVTVNEPPKVPVTIPTASSHCKSDLKYTGSPLTITKDPGEGYTFTGNINTNVGTYTVTANLKEGYIWSDNTLSDKTFKCSILNPDSYINFDDKLTINNTYITPKQISKSGMTYSEFVSNIDTNGNISYSKSGTDMVATCDDVTITFYDMVQVYTLIIKGDVTKSGTIGTQDSDALFKYLRNEETLSTCQISASDVTGDGEIHINDVAKLYQYANGKIEGLGE